MGSPNYQILADLIESESIFNLKTEEKELLHDLKLKQTSSYENANVTINVTLLLSAGSFLISLYVSYIVFYKKTFNNNNEEHHNLLNYGSF